MCRVPFVKSHILIRNQFVLITLCFHDSAKPAWRRHPASFMNLTWREQSSRTVLPLLFQQTGGHRGGESGRMQLKDWCSVSISSCLHDRRSVSEYITCLLTEFRRGRQRNIFLNWGLCFTGGLSFTTKMKYITSATKLKTCSLTLCKNQHPQ